MLDSPYTTSFIIGNIEITVTAKPTHVQFVDTPSSPITDTRANSIDHPPHYTVGKIEVIDFIEDQTLGFHLGNVVKYVCRAKHKNGIEDLKKAAWYLARAISLLEDKDKNKNKKDS